MAWRRKPFFFESLIACTVGLATGMTLSVEDGANRLLRREASGMHEVTNMANDLANEASEVLQPWLTVQQDRVTQAQGNPSGYFDCKLGFDGFEKVDEFLLNHSFDWPRRSYEDYLTTRKGLQFFNSTAGKMIFPIFPLPMYCPMDGVTERFHKIHGDNDGFKLGEVKDLFSSLQKTLTVDGQPVILIAVTSAPLETVSNTLCALQRVGRLERTILFFGHTIDNGDSKAARLEQLRQMRMTFPKLHIVETNIEPEVENSTKSEVWLLWRSVPVLALLELGYPVLQSELDVHWVQDPFKLMAKFQDADIVGSYESCLEWNAGIVFFKPTERSRLVLRNALAMRLPTIGKDTFLDTSADQWSLSCAMVHGVVKLNASINTIPRQQTPFSWAQIGQFFAERCVGVNASRVSLESFPYAFHTSGTSSKNRPANLKTLGLWEITEDSKAQCIAGHDLLAQCHAGIKIPNATGNVAKDYVNYLYREGPFKNMSAE